MLNLIAAEMLLAGGILVTLVLTWPDPPWDALLWGGIPVLVAFPIATYPVTKLLWLAFDLMFRPPTPRDFAPGKETGPPGGGA
jgi:hypothetical protein